MKLNVNESLGTLLTQYPALRNSFETYRLDYCCGGKQSLKDAAASAGLDLDRLVNEFVEALKTAPSAAVAQDWSQASAEELCRYITDRHHTFMRRQLPLLRSLFDDVRAAHGATHGGLLDAMHEVFDALAAEIEMHLEKEEQILFPYVEQIERHVAAGGPMPEVHCGTVQNPIRQMEYEHDNAGEALAKLRRLSLDYQPPSDACEKFKALYEELARLENDLHEHIHLENNILFPKAVQLEQRAAAANA